jgi:alpha-L-fucosidase 2
MYSAAVLEMLVQSHNGIIQIFPAVPDVWQNVSFGSLRCEGAFLVWAQRKNGKTASVHMKSGIGGLCRMRNPYKGKTPYVVSRHSVPTVYKKELISFETKPNESYMIKFH